MARRAPLLYAGSLAMVLLQSATAVGVMIGTIAPSCATSDQCGAGMYCQVGVNDRCWYCGWGPVENNDIGNLTRVAEVCTLPYVERVGLDGGGNDIAFPDTAVASWCETCVRNDGTVDPLTGKSLRSGNLAAMGPFDHVAFVIAAFTVAFTVVGELKDIELCSMAVAHAGDKLSKGWRLALGFLLWMRRWVFLPTLVMNVPMLVLAVLGGVAGRSWGGVWLPILAFLLGGVAEAFVPGASAAETAKRAGKVLGAWLLGQLGWLFLMVLSVSL